MEFRRIQHSEWQKRHRRQLAVIALLACFVLVAATASGSYVWHLLRWESAGERSRSTLVDESAPLNKRMDALVILQRNAELDLALLRRVAQQDTDLGRLAAVAARRVEESGR